MDIFREITGTLSGDSVFIIVCLLFAVLGGLIGRKMFGGQKRFNLQLQESFNIQKESFQLQKKSSKVIEELHHQLSTAINELKRSNRFLAEIAALEPLDDFQVAPSSTPVRASVPVSATRATTEFEESDESVDEQASDNQFKLYVGNIDYAATEAELAAHFASYGPVEFVNIPVNRYTGKTRGFGFVTFGSREDAERAMALHGTEFKGRQIQVNFAKERDYTT